MVGRHASVELNVETVVVSTVLNITNSMGAAIPLAWRITGGAAISRKTNSFSIVVAKCPFVLLGKSFFVSAAKST